MELLDRWFGLSKEGTTVGIEVRAGITTWLTMAYILFVNAGILSEAIKIPGDNAFAQILTATALASALGCFVMGLWAKYPFALAPGMGLNAFFSYTVVLTMGVSWQSALAAVFVAGCLFIVLSLTGIRTVIINAIPLVLKRATAVGIGFFLAIIGFVNSGIVSDHPATLVTLGHLGEAGPLLTLLGVFAISVALAHRVKGAILLGIGVVTCVAIIFSLPVFQGQAFEGFSGGIVQAPVWPSDLFFAMDFSNLFDAKMIGVVFGFLFVDFFDTAGTLLGLAEKAGFTDKEGRLERATQAFTADAIATTAGAAIGVSPTTSYIESASGIEEGGRTGLTAIVVGLLFLVSIFFWPLASAIPAVATAPALIVVGAFMVSAVTKIDWDDYSVAIPAFLTVVTMPLTYSISNGIALGIVSYTVIQMGTLKFRDIHPIMYLLTILLSVYLLSNG